MLIVSRLIRYRNYHNETRDRNGHHTPFYQHSFSLSMFLPRLLVAILSRWNYHKYGKLYIYFYVQSRFGTSYSNCGFESLGWSNKYINITNGRGVILTFITPFKGYYPKVLIPDSTKITVPLQIMSLFSLHWCRKRLLFPSILEYIGRIVLVRVSLFEPIR